MKKVKITILSTVLGILSIAIMFAVIVGHGAIDAEYFRFVSPTMNT